MGNKAPQIDPKEQAKQNKRTIDRAVRKIEREQKKMQGMEQKQLKEIKALAQKNQHVSFYKYLTCEGACQNDVKRSCAYPCIVQLVLCNDKLTQGDFDETFNSWDQFNNDWRSQGSELCNV